MELLRELKLLFSNCFTCQKCSSSGECMCMAKKFDWSYQEENPPTCCAKRCFQLENLEVDGLACTRCWCYSQCYCRCKTWMKDFAKVAKKREASRRL